MNDAVLRIIIPVGIAIVVVAVLCIIRWRIYIFFNNKNATIKTEWGRVIISYTRILSFAWCIWLGVFAGLQFFTSPAWVSDKLIPIGFIALGTWAFIILILCGLKWYSLEIARHTSSKVDDAVAVVLKIFLPLWIGFIAIVYIVDIAGLNVILIKEWLGQYLLNLSLILGFGIIILLVITALIPRIIESSITRLHTDEAEVERKKRADTLVSVLTLAIQFMIIVIMFLMILSEFGKDPWTMLAGLSIIGVAVGLGAQSLVKDMIAGTFVIFENQYRRGDVVRIADVSGVVEEINLRRTILRDLDGIVHVIPNGEIRVASNFTKLWSRVNLNISVAYDTDLDKAASIINKVGQELAEDPKWSPAIILPPRFLRVDKFGDSGIELKILGDTQPIRQWEVMGELRLRLKRAFDKEGIEIPWPHTKVYFGDKNPFNRQ